MSNVISIQKVKDFHTPLKDLPINTTLSDGKRIKYTDIEIASLIHEELAKKHDLIFSEGKFMRYGSSHWEEIKDQDMRYLVQFYDRSRNATSAVSLTKTKIDSVIDALKTIVMNESTISKEPAVGINCQNGFIKFDQNGIPSLTDHDKHNFCRHTLPGNWDPLNSSINRKGSLLEKLFDGVFKDDEDKEDKIKLIAEICGSTALGYATKLHQPKAVILKGEKAENGKSQILDIIRGVLPKEAISAIPPAKMSDDKYIWKLIGAHLNASDELGTANAITSDVFKTVITGEPITARDVYKSASHFSPIAQHVFATNVLPPFKGGMDRGVQRRLLVITFNSVIPLEGRIAHIGKRIATEEPDLLLDFAVEGASRLIRQKNFTVSSSSLDALNNWVFDADPVVEWLQECTGVAEPTHWVTTRKAYEYFKAWFATSELNQEYMVAMNTFVSRVTANAPNGVFYKRKNDGRYFFGLNIRVTH